jgi:hypothetical protein
MVINARNKYKQFTTEQIQRLVDRDLSHMNKEERLRIIDQFLNLSPEEVNAETCRLEHEIEDEMKKI